MNTFERVVQMLNDMDVADGVDLTANTTFEELGLDSLSIVEISMSCEDEFGIEMDAEAVPSTLGELVALIESKL